MILRPITILVISSIIIISLTGCLSQKSEIPETRASAKESLSIKEDNRPIVVIDPGHGGDETGAIGWTTNVPEKEITLQIALYCKEYLEDQNIRVEMTRIRDQMLNPSSQKEDLHARAGLAQIVNGQLFVSIHADQFNETVHGSKVFYSEINPETDQSMELAEYVFSSLVDEINSKPLSVQMEDFIVLRENTVPSILVEAGFVSNKAEEEKLISPEYQKKTGIGIAKGIVKYLHLNKAEED